MTHAVGQHSESRWLVLVHQVGIQVKIWRGRLGGFTWIAPISSAEAARGAFGAL